MAKDKKKSSGEVINKIELPCYAIFITVTKQGAPVAGCDELLVVGNVPTTHDYVPLRPAGTPTFTIHKTTVTTVVRIRCTQGTPFFYDVTLKTGVTADQRIEIILQPCSEH